MISPESSFALLSSARAVDEYPVGNLTIAVHRDLLIRESGFSCHPSAWLDPSETADFLASGMDVLVDESGAVLLRRGEGADDSARMTAVHSFLIRHPWDLLRANERHVGALTESSFDGTVHPSAVLEGVVRLGRGSRILPGVFIEGNVVIGENCKIGPNCYLRGNTSIGNSCHIGQSVEIKNSLILSGTNVGHLSYVGDSVLGEKVNFGAGTITSNLRHDGKNHRSVVDGELVDTGRRKFGAIVGDGVHTGINTSIYPGRKLWAGSSTRPGEIVQRDKTCGC